MRVIKLFSLVFFLLFALWILYCFFTLPDLSGVGNKTRSPSITVLDDKNNIIGSLGDVYGGVTDIHSISSYLKYAVVVLEDKRFYNHGGVDFKSLIRAIKKNIKERRYVQGASTITQQLSKLLFLNSDKNLSRKLRELIIALYLENNYSKEEILYMYLNRVYLGSGLYGIKAASQRYFSKLPKDLSIAESAVLAGMLKAPSRLSLFVDSKASTKRAKLVLDLLYKEGYINENQKINSQKELIFISKKRYINSAFTRYYIDWIYSKTPEDILKTNKDLIVNSSLNLKMQKITYDVVKKVSKNLDKKIQVAVVIMNSKGAIKSLIGGRSWTKSKFNRATQSKRQIGSVFKTYVYLTALNAGYKPSDKILDEPISTGSWTPKNFANSYEGKISLERAFAISSNVAAVRLADSIGAEAIISQAKKLGIISEITKEPSMALGVSSLSLIEVSGSFGAICGEGKPVIPFGLESIRLRSNELIWKRETPQRKKIIKNKTLKSIKSLLREVVNQGTARKLSSLPFEIIGKTGTSQNNRDAWFIGCAKEHVIGVWLGRDDDRSMKNIFGSTVPLEVFKRIVTAL